MPDMVHDIELRNSGGSALTRSMTNSQVPLSLAVLAAIISVRGSAACFAVDRETHAMPCRQTRDRRLSGYSQGFRQELVAALTK
jgi:hypothetical protein